MLLIGGFYLYQQHTVVPVQERIYEIPERSERQATPLPLAFQQTPVRSTSPPDVSEIHNHRHLEASDEHESVVSAKATESDSFVTDDSAIEDISSASLVHDRVDDDRPSYTVELPLTAMQKAVSSPPSWV